MNSATNCDSGMQSQRQSLSEIETDFKRDMKESSLEYMNIVKNYESAKAGNNVDEKTSEDTVDEKTSKGNSRMKIY